MNRRRWCTALLWAGLAPAAYSGTPACPTLDEIEPPMLVGTWRVDFTDGARQRGEEPWTLVLGPHPEYAGSLKGTLSRGPQRHLVVADWDDGQLTMEESEDGEHIAATWLATPTTGQCGQLWQGQRFTGSEPDASARRFRMRSDRPR